AFAYQPFQINVGQAERDSQLAREAALGHARVFLNGFEQLQIAMVFDVHCVARDYTRDSGFGIRELRVGICESSVGGAIALSLTGRAVAVLHAKGSTDVQDGARGEPRPENPRPISGGQLSELRRSDFERALCPGNQGVSSKGPYRSHYEQL